MAARLLAERVPHRDVVEQIVQKFEVTAGTAREDLKKIYSEWANSAKDEQAGNLALAVNSCLEEIRRLRYALDGRPDSKGRATEAPTANSEFKYSMALLKWETHLARLQGVLGGRVDVTSDGEPINIVMNIPAGPFSETA